MDLPQIKIQGVVAAKKGENPFRRKGTGFLALFINQELVGPNCKRNSLYRKGKLVNIPALNGYARQRKPPS